MQYFLEAEDAIFVYPQEKSKSVEPILPWPWPLDLGIVV